MNEFLVGLYVAFTLVAVVSFVGFWRNTRDGLFVKFAAALLILAGERVALLAAPVQREANSFIYILRLVAFALIIWALIDKNKRKKATGEESGFKN